MSVGGPVLVFDSGVGGLSVLRELRRSAPERRFIYIADDAAFPYGDWPELALKERIVDMLAFAARLYRPAAIVIACNTASTLVLERLRDVLTIPVIGTVPAIKPAAQTTRSGLISVLATPGTVRRDYTFELIRQFAPEVAVTLVGAKFLARLAQAKLTGGGVDEEILRAEIAPCFCRKDGRRTDVVVLACTHYPFLLPELRRLAHWEVEWIDPSRAIARRLLAVLGEQAGRELMGGEEEAPLPPCVYMSSAGDKAPRATGDFGLRGLLDRPFMRADLCSEY